MEDKILKTNIPRHMTLEEMEQIYWDNWILMSNIKRNSRGVEGGTVRYYSEDSDILFDKMSELEQSPEEYGKCTVFYMGDRGGGLRGLFI